LGTTSTASPESTTTTSVRPTTASGRLSASTTQPLQSTTTAESPDTTLPFSSAGRTSGIAANEPTSDQPKSPGITAMLDAFSITP
jgi:hypothetical protein